MKKRVKSFIKMFPLSFGFKVSKRKRGFSIVETLIALSVFAMIAISTTLTINELKNKNTLEYAQASIITTLEQARNQAATGIGNSGRCILIEEKKLSVFEESCEGTSTEVLLPLSVSTNHSGTYIVFERLTANSTSTTITLNHFSGANTTITVEKDGRISQP